MPISALSFAIFRHPTAALSRPSSAAAAAASRFSTISLAATRDNPNSAKRPNKSLLRAKESIKEFSSLSLASPDASCPSLLPNQAVGLVAAAQANFMRVIINQPSNSHDTPPEAVGMEILCVVRAVLKKIRRRVLVGDKVVVGSIDWVDRRGMIENVFERKTEILDPPIANVDHLLVLFSMDQPKPEPFSLTRFLVEAESTGIPLTLALNKMELVQQETLLAWKARLRSWGYDPLFCSVDSKNGLDTLADTLKEQTTVIVGPSGVGKSSLINALRSNQYESDQWLARIESSKWFQDQRVGEVSLRSGRGKHTTRNVSLLPLAGGGYLADTPGFNQPSLLKVTKKSLAQMFPEVRQMISANEPKKCSFNDCLHLGEPGCVVKGDWERYPYYLQLLDEIKIREEFQLRTMGTKREGDVRYKMGDMGVKQAEPRLEPKKHRRVSRKRLNQSMLNELNELDELEEDDYFSDVEGATRR